jgi:hypothetical protein
VFDGIAKYRRYEQERENPLSEYEDGCEACAGIRIPRVTDQPVGFDETHPIEHHVGQDICAPGKNGLDGRLDIRIDFVPATEAAAFSNGLAGFTHRDLRAILSSDRIRDNAAYVFCRTNPEARRNADYLVPSRP